MKDRSPDAGQDVSDLEPFLATAGVSRDEESATLRGRVPSMHRYAIWGTATSPAHEAWVSSIGDAFEADGFARVDDIADADFVLNMFDAEQPKAEQPKAAKEDWR